jgi:hypothetical protein
VKVPHAYNFSTQEAEEGRLQIGVWPGLQSEYHASLGYMVIPCLKTATKTKTKHTKKLSLFLYFLSHEGLGKQLTFYIFQVTVF